MNFVQDFESALSSTSSSSSSSRSKLITNGTSSYDGPQQQQQSASTSFNATSSSNNNQYEYLMSDVVDNLDATGIADCENTSRVASHLHSKSIDSGGGGDTSMQQVVCRNNSTLATTNGSGSGSIYSNGSASSMMSYSSSYCTLRRSSRSTSSSAVYNNGSSSNGFAPTVERPRSTVGKVQFVLMAPTSPGVKVNEDSLTYLNQGQNYELKFSARVDSTTDTSVSFDSLNQYCYMGDSSNNSSSFDDVKPAALINLKNRSSTVDESEENEDSQSSNKMEDRVELTDLSNSNKSKETAAQARSTTHNYLSVIRLCFWDRKLQEIEHEEIKEWEKEYLNIRMLEIDSNASYGTVEIRLSEELTNAAEVIWNGQTGASIFFRCNCTSTAFAPHKHGGEKGIHMRLQIDTYEMNPTFCNKLKQQQQTSSDFLDAQSILSPGKMLKDDFDTASTVADGGVGSSSSPDYQLQPRRSARLNSNRPPGSATPAPSTPSGPSGSSLDSSTNNWCDYWRHVCTSYSRVQLFRLKGAQRKLKTDRNKVERLSPPDLRKRYQPSSKITILNNCPFDPLYSLLPFERSDFNPMKAIPINNGIGSTMATTLQSTNSQTSIDNNSSGFYSLYGGLESDMMRDPMNYLGNGASGAAYSMASELDTGYGQPYLSAATQPILLDQSSSLLSDVNGASSYNKTMMMSSMSYQPQISAESIGEGMSDNGATILDETSSRYPSFFLESGSSGAYGVSNPIELTTNSSRNPTAQKIYAPTAKNGMSGGLLNGDDSESPNLMLNGQFMSSEDNSTHYNSNRLKRNSSIANGMIHAGSQSSNNYAYSGNGYKSKIQKIASTGSSLCYSSSNLMNPSSTNLQSTSTPQLYSTFTQNFLSPSSSSSSSSTSSVPSPGSPTMSSLANATNTSSNPTPTASSSNNSSTPNSIYCQQASVSYVSGGDAVNGDANSVYVNNSLPYNCTSKYLQEWMISNRFGNLLNVFINYTTNDLLRLSKEDMISLCGAPDGIRCFNMAHNIQIKPKLTIFVTFQAQSYFSAIFLTDWKSKCLVEKICSLYGSYVKGLKSENADSENNKGNQASLHYSMYSQVASCLGHFDFELFLKIKGILVKTTDEVLNNLQDQSRFLIEFDLPTVTKGHQQQSGVMRAASEEKSGEEGTSPSAMNANASSRASNRSNSELRPSRDKLTIILIPVDQ